MQGFRIFMACIFIAIVLYTIPVVLNHGLFSLFGVFFGDIARMQWPGQFNLDFMGFLLMSGVWLAWRHDFSPAGLGLAAGGFLLGAPFLSAYLFLTSRQVGGSWAVLYLGERRAAEYARAT